MIVINSASTTHAVASLSTSLNLLHTQLVFSIMFSKGLLITSTPTYTKTRRTHNRSNVWLHVFRFVQFLASPIVADVMLFFIHHLRDTNVTIPWMFFLVSLSILPSNLASNVCKLQAAALTTFSWVILSLLLHYSSRLSPFCNAFVNGLTVCLCTVAFTLLAWRMGTVTDRGRTTALWGRGKSVLVCRLYK